MSGAPTTQLPLALFPAEKADPNVAYLIGVLQGRDWTRASEIIQIVVAQTTVEWHDRKVRELAAMSKGQIAGGQKGYKLVTLMTHEEYQHWRNWMSSQANEMTGRVLAADKVFYARKPVQSGNGIL